jgi:uncharacterized membrane protein YhdT
MIQRIQTVFLLISAIAGICLFFFPVAGIYSSSNTYIFYIHQLKNMVPGEPSAFSFMTVFPLLLLNILATGLSVTAILMYKNRINQVKAVRFAIFLTIILIGLIFFVYARIIENKLGASPDYLDEAGIYFPLIMLIFLILANRSIVRDERLVRSADRLR